MSFPDLDETLLNHETYSFEKALHVLALIKRQEIPLVICSSKTKARIEYYRKKLVNRQPFISEKGGGIFSQRAILTPCLLQLLALSKKTWSQVFRTAKGNKGATPGGFPDNRFGYMTTQELADHANMKIQEAVMAKERDFDEPFIGPGGGSSISLAAA